MTNTAHVELTLEYETSYTEEELIAQYEEQFDDVLVTVDIELN